MPLKKEALKVGLKHDQPKSVRNMKSTSVLDLFAPARMVFTQQNNQKARD